MSDDQKGDPESDERAKQPKRVLPPPAAFMQDRSGHVAEPDPEPVDEDDPPGTRLARALGYLAQVRPSASDAATNRALASDAMATAVDASRLGRHPSAWRESYEAARLTVDAAMSQLGVRISPEVGDHHQAEVEFAGHLMGSSGATARKQLDQLRKVRHGISYAADMPDSSASAVRVAGELQRRISAALHRLTPEWPQDWPDQGQ